MDAVVCEVVASESVTPSTAAVIQPAQGQHPWLRFGKMYSRDDPQIREWLDIIAARRNQADVELQQELEAEYRVPAGVGQARGQAR